MKVYAILADGFEEVEALAVVDILKRAKVDTKMVSIQEQKLVTGVHGISIHADILFADADFSACDLIFLPGGMPGTRNLNEYAGLLSELRAFAEEEKRIAAICAAPMVLGGLGLLKGRKAVCFPGFEEYLTGAEIVNERVVTDGNITTSKGMGTAIDLGLELVRLLCGEELSEELGRSIQYT